MRSTESISTMPATLTAFLLILVSLGPDSAQAVCCPVPWGDWQLQSTAQVNLVILHEDVDEISVVPNITFSGNAADFALLVPTPTVPELSPAPVEIWPQAGRLTAPLNPNRNGDSGCATTGCTEADEIPLTADAGGGVDIISEERVGDFIAVILRADDAVGLVGWLTDNGFVFDAEAESRFAAFVEQDWVFTAMRLDLTDPDNQIPVEGWNHSVAPVEFRYAATEFELALPIIAINRAEFLPLRFYVVADHRQELPEFRTSYANRVSDREWGAIQRQHPELSAFVDAGKFLTRLDRTFFASDPMDEAVLLRRAANDDEHRDWIGASRSALPWPWILLVLSLVASAAWRRWRVARGAVR